MKPLYSLTITISALLLFSVEPMVTRALLPQLGGSSAVWISALAFFQVTLMLGYAYTTAVAGASTQRTTAWLAHLGLLLMATLAAFLPLSQGVAPAGHLQNPQLRLFLLLGTTVGLPFFALSTTAPLLQAWYARREQAGVPYRLFALSNAASLAALLAYPTLVEPALKLNTQFLLWRAGFVVYALSAACLTVRMRSAEPRPTAVTNDEVSARASAPAKTRLLWFALPAVASMQLAAITAHLTQDIASMPLLWVIPLAAYLLSFVLAFELPPLYRRSIVLRMLAVLLFALGYFLAQTEVNVPIGIAIGFFTAELLVAAWFCHAELFALRPQQATASANFYLYIAAGGAAGTLTVAIVSPLLSDSNFDLPVSFLLTAALVLLVTWREGLAPRLLWFTATALAVYLLADLHSAYTQDALFRARNFYGPLRVKQTQTPPQAFLSRTLYNGNIQHGMQWFSDEFRQVPLTYYAPDSGVGLALTYCCDTAQSRRIGVIGLGAGTLAAYGRSADSIRFYEINPLVIDVAQHLFTYTRNTPASVTTVPGDARLSLAADPSQRFDVLVIDAFSGDSIPTHLLTREALTLYLRHLAPGGVLAFHISNQYLDLAPVVARLAESTQTTGTPMQAREVDSAPDRSRGESLASWVLLTSRPAFFAQGAVAAASQSVHTLPEVKLWTDQYSSLLPILRWSGRHIAASGRNSAASGSAPQP